jgi:hypothetical protein
MSPSIAISGLMVNFPLSVAIAEINSFSGGQTKTGEKLAC